MMHKTLSGFGSLLVVAGIVMLGYVGITYLHQQSTPTKHWSVAQQQEGRHLAAVLKSRQRVILPKALKTSHLPRAGSEPAVRIVIPKIGVDSPVVQTAPVNGVWNVADWAVGHLSTTPNPGARGNGAYAGHDDIKGEVFKRIAELRPGDAIKLRTAHATYTYVVTGQQAVDPSNVSVLAPTQLPTVTLVSCAPYWVDTQRLVVQGVLKSESAR